MNHTTLSYTPEQINSISEMAFEKRRFWHRFSDGTREYRTYEVVPESRLPQPVEVVVEQTHSEKRYIFPDGRIFSDVVRGEKSCRSITIEWGNTPMRTTPIICCMAEVK